jgi:23S rRNA (guanosine2251-2'-O)-methyltransferase
VARRGGGSTDIEGVRPVIEAIRAGRRRVLEVRLPERGSTPGMAELEALVEREQIRRNPARRAGEISARAEPYPEESFEDLLLASGPRLLVALDRVTDVGNLGSIARSAEAAGATGLVLEYRNAPPIGAGALRASAGALEHLRVGRTPNLGRALELARSEGLTILAAEADGQAIDQLEMSLLRSELVWVFGSENRGIRAGLRQRVDRTVAIPLQGQISSLGVAAAAAYLLQRTAEVRRTS